MTFGPVGRLIWRHHQLTVSLLGGDCSWQRLDQFRRADFELSGHQTGNSIQSLMNSSLIKPEDVIQRLTVEELAAAAEKYFQAITDPIRLMGKPFSGLLEGPENLQNMGLLLSGLRLGSTMTVLDFGAGTCWFSRYLNQFQCQTISCDVSATALKIGRRMFAEYPVMGGCIAEPRFLHFDGRKLDLPDESVDRIVCNDAFHHVPNQEEVLAEMARVLKIGGIAGFVEPGRYHSRSAQSQYEMKNYKVLENNICATEIFAMAKRHGFDDIKFKLLTDIELSLSQYKAVTGLLVGAKWQKIVKNIRHVTARKTIFFLHKGCFVPDSRGHLGLAHIITLPATEATIAYGSDLQIPLQIINTGAARWLHHNIRDIGVVKIGTHLYTADDTLLDHDFSRHPFKDDVEPGAVILYTIKVPFPERGVFKLSIDLVSEGICWFENVRSQPQFVTVTVQ